MTRSLLALVLGGLLLGGALLLGLEGEVGEPPPTLRAAPCPVTPNAEHGSLERVTPPGEPAAFRARYDGGGANGYARGVVEVSWPDGDEVAYGAELFLPRGLLGRLGGQLDLMRWDNFRSHPGDADWGGIVVFGSDHRARLVRFRAAGGGVDELVGPFELPEGRWFRLDVRQRLGAGGEASSVVELDGRRVGDADEPNAYGRTIERVRFGVVAIAAGDQREPLELLFRRAGATTQSTPAGEPACVTSARTPPAP